MIKLPLLGVGAAWISAGVKPGSTIAVFGLGTIGCAVRRPRNSVFLFLWFIYNAEKLIANEWFHRLLRELDFEGQLGLLVWMSTQKNMKLVMLYALYKNVYISLFVLLLCSNYVIDFMSLFI